MCKNRACIEPWRIHTLFLCGPKRTGGQMNMIWVWKSRPHWHIGEVLWSQQKGGNGWQRGHNFRLKESNKNRGDLGLNWLVHNEATPPSFHYYSLNRECRSNQEKTHTHGPFWPRCASRRKECLSAILTHPGFRRAFPTTTTHISTCTH